MNILLLGEGPGVRGILARIMEKTRHRLIQHSWEDMPEPDLEPYDMVLVDGNVCGCTQQERLLQWVSAARSRYPELPVVALNDLCIPEEAEGEKADRRGYSCGIAKSANGKWLSRCRLKELALNETTALLRDACERTPLEPFVFECSGQS